MESVHTIRLRDPWEQHQSPDGCLHRRTFHPPTGIEQTKAVWVVVNAQTIPAEIRCNGVLLGIAHQQAAFEITPLLQASNQLEMLIPQSASGTGEASRGAVHLEIRDTLDAEPPTDNND